MLKLPFFGKKKTEPAVAQPVDQATPVPATTQTKEPSFFQKRKQINAEQAIYERGLVNVLDYIAPSAFGVTPQYVQLENLYAKNLFVFSYARYLNTNWLSRIVNLDIQTDISMFIYPLPTADVMSDLRRKITQLESTETIEQEKGQVRDPQLQTAIGDIEGLRDALSRGEDRLFQFGLYFTVYSKSLDELETIVKQLEALLGGLLIYTKQALMQQEQAFNSILPMANDELLVTRNLDTAALSTSFPFVSSTLTSNDGILYGVNLHNSSLILFDRFESLENANAVVFATSGAGKSFMVKLEALRSLMLGTDVIVIDPENEYERLCNAVGGTYLSLSLNSPERVNPFDLPKTTIDEKGEDILRSAVVSIKNLVGIMVSGLSPEEDALLDRAVYETYALKDITADIKSQQNEPPLMKDLQNILTNMTGAENLVRRLSKFTEGSFAGLFNQPTNINLNNGFVVFSIRDLEEQLRPIGMFLLLTFIWNQARFQMKKRFVIIDEAWILMRYKDSSDFLYSLSKRARKYFLGLTIITQDVEDFISSQQGRTIVNNSAMRLLLRQSPSAVDKLAEVFKLTEGEKLILREAKVGQGIFFAGANHVAIEVIASYEEEQLITTNPAELMKMKEAEEERAATSLGGQVAPVVNQKTTGTPTTTEANQPIAGASTASQSLVTPPITPAPPQQNASFNQPLPDQNMPSPPADGSSTPPPTS
jgi:type IV secretory pathway VirB4 component